MATIAGKVLRWPAGVPLERRVADLMIVQHGVASSEQLRACGLSGRAARGRAATGRLHRIHRGVYALCPVLPRLGPLAAAVLACGPGAVISHLTAARLHALRPDGRTVIEVTAGTASGRRHGSLVLHSAASLRPCDVSWVEGIPVTSPARTLLDCAPRLGRRGIEKLVIEAERLRAFDLMAIEDVLEHVPAHHGSGTLRAAVADAAGARGQTASPTEDDLLEAFRAIRSLPEPDCNAPIQLDDGSFVVADFLWRDAMLIVEADPRSSHDRTPNYRSDRTRDRALDRLGYETMRFNDLELRDPAACATEAAERHSFRARTARKL